MVVHLGNQVYNGLSSETKPTGVASGVARFTELNTQTDFLYNGTNWIPMGASGAVTFEFGSSSLTGAAVVCTAASGGTQMPSVSGFSALVRSISGNNTMMIGTTTNPPSTVTNSGFGIPLYGGDYLNMKITNLSTLRVLAGTSGQVITYIVVAQ